MWMCLYSADGQHGKVSTTVLQEANVLRFGNFFGKCHCTSDHNGTTLKLGEKGIDEKTNVTSCDVRCSDT